MGNRENIRPEELVFGPIDKALACLAWGIPTVDGSNFAYQELCERQRHTPPFLATARRRRRKILRSISSRAGIGQAREWIRPPETKCWNFVYIQKNGIRITVKDCYLELLKRHPTVSRYLKETRKKYNLADTIFEVR